MKHAPLKDLCHLGGWKNAQTVVQVYQRPDDETLVEALAQRRPYGAAVRKPAPIDTTPSTAQKDDARRAS